MNTTAKLWAADPHQFGPGKVHIVNVDDESKTFCGRALAAIAGKMSATGRATCRTCLNAFELKPERDAQRAQWQAANEQREADRVAQNERWWTWYTEYLRSPEWRSVRARAIARAKGTCEGCAERPATQAHHLTYAHVGAEFLWELRAVCDPCHDRLHEDKARDR